MLHRTKRTILEIYDALAESIQTGKGELHWCDCLWLNQRKQQKRSYLQK